MAQESFPYEQKRRQVKKKIKPPERTSNFELRLKKKASAQMQRHTQTHIPHRCTPKHYLATLGMRGCEIMHLFTVVFIIVGFIFPPKTIISLGLDGECQSNNVNMRS